MNVSVLFALDIRQTKRISSARHSIEYVLCLAVLHFSRLSHKQHFVRNKFIEHKTLGLIFSTNLHEAFLILRKIHRDCITYAHRSSCKAAVTLVRFYWNLNFLNIFSRNAHILDFMKSCSVGSEFFPCGRAKRRNVGQTDRHDEANSGFSQFCERT